MERKKPDGLFNPLKKRLGQQLKTAKSSQLDPMDLYRSIGKGFRSSSKFLKKHPKFGLSGLVLIVLLIIGGIIGSNVSNANRARADEERRLANIARQKDECVKKSQSSNLRFATTSYSGRDDVMDLKVGGDFLSDEKPEVFVDGQKIAIEKDKIKIEKNRDCEKLGVNFYGISVDLQSNDCKEKMAKFKTSTAEKEKDVINDRSCKTKAEIEADKKARAEAEARKQREDAERQKKQNEDPVSELDALTTSLANGAIGYRSSDSKMCLVEYTADSTKFLNDKALARNSTTLFIETGKKVFMDPNCGDFVLYYNATTDGGETRMATFSVYRDVFGSYKWDTLRGKPVGIQLEQADILGIPLTKDLEPGDFIYN